MQDVPIIDDPLDRDYYMETMGQLAHLRLPTVTVDYAFTNRTKDVALARELDLGEVREHCEHARTLRCDDARADFLASQGVFCTSYLERRKTIGMPEARIASTTDGRLVMESTGPFADTMPWESAICIVNELYFRKKARESGRTPEEIENEGMRRLDAKIDRLAAYPDLRIMEFGTRRRFSRRWQRRVLERLLERVPKQIAGTSNVALAREFGIAPLGTMAHALFMVYGAVHRKDWNELRATQGDGFIDTTFLASHDLALRDFEGLYGPGMTVALTDTYGSDFAFRTITPEQAMRWRGMRQDSGDPIAFGERLISFYEEHGVDPRTKLFVPSDSLDMEAAIALHERFSSRILALPGIGTNLTNDVGFRTLSLIMKAVTANGVPTVKLSDNAAKAQGPTDVVREIVRMVGHRGSSYVECVN